MPYSAVNLWNQAGFKSATEKISDLDPNNFVASQLLNNFSKNTTYNDLIYNPENNNKLTNIYKKVDAITLAKSETKEIGNQQILSKIGLESVNNPQPIFGSTSSSTDTSNQVFTWNYTSVDNPDIINLKGKVVYLAELTSNHLSNATNGKVTITAIAKTEIDTPIELDLNIYQETIDSKGVKQTLILNLDTINVSEVSKAISQNRFVKSFVNFTIGDSRNSIFVGDFTPPDGTFTSDDPITFMINSEFNPAGIKSTKYFIGLEDKTVGGSGTGIVTVTTDLLSPGGGTRPWCEGALFAGHIYNGAGSSMIHYAYNCQNWLSQE